MTDPSDPALIRASTAAKRLGKHISTLKRWSEEGILPEPIRLGPRGDRHYRAEHIDAVLKNGASRSPGHRRQPAGPAARLSR